MPRLAGFSGSLTISASPATPSSSTRLKRRGDVHLAGRRHDAVSRREEHQLGGQLSRARGCAGPALVPERTEINGIFSAEDWVQTLTAAAGEPDLKNRLLKGYHAGGKTFKVHLDGYDQRDMLQAKGLIRGGNSSIGPMTATSRVCATTSTRRSSWNSRRMASRSGCSRLSLCGRRRYSICGPTRSNGRNTRRAIT